MKFLLISLFALTLYYPTISYADFGFSMTESPSARVEAIVDQVLIASNLEEKLPEKDFNNLRDALIRGALKDHEVLRNIVKVKKEFPSIKNLPQEQRLREIAYSQEYLKSTGQEFGYNEQKLSGIR